MEMIISQHYQARYEQSQQEEFSLQEFYPFGKKAS
jgi:hypothetical protein